MSCTHRRLGQWSLREPAPDETHPSSSAFNAISTSKNLSRTLPTLPTQCIGGWAQSSHSWGTLLDRTIQWSCTLIGKIKTPKNTHHCNHQSPTLIQLTPKGSGWLYMDFQSRSLVYPSQNEFRPVTRYPRDNWKDGLDIVGWVGTTDHSTTAIIIWRSHENIFVAVGISTWYHLLWQHCRQYQYASLIERDQPLIFAERMK